MEISFIPTPDVAIILNALLDKFENRAKRDHALREAEGMYNAPSNPSLNEVAGTNYSSRSIKIVMDELDLPSYFSQIEPQSRIIANQQLQTLEQQGLVRLKWLPGEINHLLYSITLQTEQVDKYTGTHAPADNGNRSTQHDTLYKLLKRTPISDHRARLESLLLAEKFRYQKSDWRARVLNHTLQQLRAGKSPSPFSLTDPSLNVDLLAVLQALPILTAETPYRVFSVHVFNDSKRFDDLKPALVRLARRANPEWRSLTSEDLLRELNLVANPGYVHLAGNWKLTDINGQIINLAFFTPSAGIPASQITSLQKVIVRAEAVLCIENLTSFHQSTNRTQQVDRYTGTYAQADNGLRAISHATICLMGNPSPAIRHLLRLIPEEIPIHLWSDMDYGGFNILSQLRRQVSPRIQPYLMDIATFDSHAHLSRPLTPSDARNLKRLLFNPSLKDIHPTIEHLLHCGLKLEQEAIQI